MGLIHRILPDDGLQAEVDATVKRVVGNAPLVNRWHKEFVRRAGQAQPYTETELARAYDFLTTEDYQEGMAAFAEKRRPQFKGK